MLRAWRFDYSAWAGNFIWAAKETRRMIEQSSIPEGTLDFSSPNGKRLNPLCLEPACYVFKKIGLGAPYVTLPADAASDFKNHAPRFLTAYYEGVGSSWAPDTAIVHTRLNKKACMAVNDRLGLKIDLKLNAAGNGMGVPYPQFPAVESPVRIGTDIRALLGARSGCFKSGADDDAYIGYYIIIER